MSARSSCTWRVYVTSRLHSLVGTGSLTSCSAGVLRLELGLVSDAIILTGSQEIRML